MALIKESPQLFSAPSSLDGLIAVLKREPSAIYKAKSNPSVYILASKLLVAALKDSFDWPESVAKVQAYVFICINVEGGERERERERLRERERERLTSFSPGVH